MVYNPLEGFIPNKGYPCPNEKLKANFGLTGQTKNDKITEFIVCCLGSSGNFDFSRYYSLYSNIRTCKTKTTNGRKRLLFITFEKKKKKNKKECSL